MYAPFRAARVRRRRHAMYKTAAAAAPASTLHVAISATHVVPRAAAPSALAPLSGEPDGPPTARKGVVGGGACGDTPGGDGGGVGEGRGGVGGGEGGEGGGGDGGGGG